MMAEKIKTYFKKRKQGLALFAAVLLGAVTSWAGTYTIMQRQVAEAEDAAEAATLWAEAIEEQANEMIMKFSENFPVDSGFSE